MGKQFHGVINVDIRDSVPDRGPYAQPTAPDGPPDVLYTAGSEKALAEAGRPGWNVVSMNDDWASVFAA